LYGFEKKGVAKWEFCKRLKTKGGVGRPRGEGVNQVATRRRQKRLEVADSKGTFFEGYPTPGVLQKEAGFY
jgi:hypothetical protein